MSTMNLNIPHYPMLRFIVRHGPWLTYLIAILVFLVGAAKFQELGSAVAVVIGIVAGVAVFVVARTLVELVQLITDMLLPK